MTNCRDGKRVVAQKSLLKSSMFALAALLPSWWQVEAAFGSSTTASQQIDIIDYKNNGSVAGSCLAIGSRLSMATNNLYLQVRNTDGKGNDRLANEIKDYGKYAETQARRIKESTSNLFPSSQAGDYNNAFVSTIKKFDPLASGEPWKAVVAWNKCAQIYKMHELELPEKLKGRQSLVDRRDTFLVFDCRANEAYDRQGSNFTKTSKFDHEWTKGFEVGRTQARGEYVLSSSAFPVKELVSEPRTVEIKLQPSGVVFWHKEFGNEWVFYLEEKGSFEPGGKQDDQCRNSKYRFQLASTKKVYNGICTLVKTREKC